MKNITHPVYGAVELDDFLLELFDTPEMQRLDDVYQLAEVRRVFRGATHTRLLHALGVCHIAGKMADHLGYSAEEKKIAQVAGLLHDLGHFPKSHTLETVVAERANGLTHETISAWVITGERRMDLPKADRIPDICRKYGVNPADVAALVTKQFKGPKYLQDTISGPMDADRLDYLCLDTHYTGVRSGTIDLERILRVLIVEDGRIKVKSKGAKDVLHALHCREHMTSHVYVHHTVRICGAMLRKAVELCPPLLRSIQEVTKNKNVLPKFYSMDDGELTVKVESYGEKAYDLMRRLRRNRDDMYKTAFQVHPGAPELAAFSKLPRNALEQNLCKRAGLQEGAVLVDYYEQPAQNTQRVLQQKGILIAKNKLEKSNYAVYGVYCAKEHVESVRAAVDSYRRIRQKDLNTSF